MSKELITLADVKTYVCSEVEGGVCEDDPRVVIRINEAIERILSKCNADKTIWRMRFCCKNNSITLPRGIERILKACRDGSPIHVFDPAYEFVDGGPWDSEQNTQPGLDLIDLGSHWVTWYEIPAATPLKLAAFSSSRDDRDLLLTIWGMGEYNHQISETLAIKSFKRVSGVVTDGLIQGALSNQTMTAGEYLQITGIKKPATTGYVTLYAMDVTNNQPYILAKYQPNELRPSFHRYKILNEDTEGTSILALVKRGYIKAEDDDDVLLIQNRMAIKMMIMAIRELEAKNVSLSQAYEMDAMGMIEAQLRDTRAPDSTTIDVDMGLQGIGSDPNIV